MELKNPKGQYAWTVTVGEKGEFVIPKQARDLFGIRPGDTLLLLGDDRKGMVIPHKDVLNQFIQRGFGEDV